MKLKEKIYYCRKKLGLSQEGLAEKIGVSRQAISKWENGDAEPEISKLRLLANTFEVTTDWLLNEDEPEEQDNVNQEAEYASSPPSSNWVDSIPGMLGNLFRRFGWLLGVYIAIGGLGFTVIGALARYSFRQMANTTSNAFSNIDNMFPSGTTLFDSFGNQISNNFSNITNNNPGSVMGSVIMTIGIIMIIGGIVLAAVLRKNIEN